MNVFLQVIDPGAFGGREAFVAETGWLYEACRSSPQRPGVAKVHMPGEHGLASGRAALTKGVPLRAAIVDNIAPYLVRAGLAWLAAM